MTRLSPYTERACAVVLTQNPERSRPLKPVFKNTDMNQDLNALGGHVTTKANEAANPVTRKLGAGRSRKVFDISGMSSSAVALLAAANTLMLTLNQLIANRLVSCSVALMQLKRRQAP